jgi:hypothetical protein
LEVAFARFRSKFLVRILHLSIQEFDRSITHLAMAGTNPDLPCAALLSGFKHLNSKAVRCQMGSI